MRREYACVRCVELSCELINEMESFNALTEHLLLDFIENLVRLIFPVHAVTKILTNLKNVNNYKNNST
jgi:hypothetical protein